MFEFIMNLFRRNKKETYNVELLIMENKRLKEELRWFYDLGLPNHQLFEEGFDYYNFLKKKVQELELDKEALMNENMRLSKIIKQQQALENLYLSEIKELKESLLRLKNEALRAVPVKETEVVCSNADEATLLKEDQKEDVELDEKESDGEQNESPLREVKKKIKGLSKNFKTYA